MSDQSQEPRAGKHPVPQDSTRKDAAPAGQADAALALAVTAAERAAGAARHDKAAPVGPADQAKVETAIPPGPGASRPVAALRWAAAVAVALAALGGAAAGGYGLAPHRPADPALLGAVAALHQGQGDVVRLTGDVKSLRKSPSTPSRRASIAPGRTPPSGRPSSWTGSTGPSGRRQDLAAGVTRLGEQLGRIEAVAKEPGAQLAGLTERLERIERQIAATAKPPAAGPAAPPAPEPAAQTGSVAKDAPVEGWVLREVYDGIALIEGRNRRLVEVGPGESVPGVGRVEAIERRGKRWVVVTAKGLIAMPR